MDIREFPIILLREFGTNIRQEGKYTVADGPEGAFLSWEGNGNTLLKIWVAPWAFERSVKSTMHRPLLTIGAGTVPTGVWSCVGGRRMEERAWVAYPIGTLPLDHPDAPFVGRTITRAAELTRSGAFEMTEFWEADRERETGLKAIEEKGTDDELPALR